MIRLLILCLTSTSAFAVSNPEIATKSGKSPSTSTTQQQATQKATSAHDDPLLNSINAYAQQYESVASSKQPYGITTQLYSQPYTPPTNFKPSAPTIETNFQPMPSTHHHHAHIQAQQSPPTPFIMQYLPQSPINDGVQYLQLIPTRPLIVPISPYMSPMSHAYQAPQIISPPLNDFSGRSLASVEPDQASSIPYGLQAYANSLQNYRSYRTNREIKPSNIPTAMSLNMNEYMPSPNDAPKPMMMIRGRP